MLKNWDEGNQLAFHNNTTANKPKGDDKKMTGPIIYVNMEFKQTNTSFLPNPPSSLLTHTRSLMAVVEPLSGQLMFNGISR